MWRVIEPERFRQFDLFGTFSDEELHALARLAHVEQYRRNELIIAEGTRGDRLFFIMDGAVRVSRTIPGLGEEALAIINAGSYFGEMALFGDQRRSADVYADKRTTLWMFDIEEFRAFLESYEQAAIKFLWACARTMADRVRSANAKVTFLSAAGRFER